jgi:hypothetical protein
MDAQSPFEDRVILVETRKSKIVNGHVRGSVSDFNLVKVTIRHD